MKLKTHSICRLVKSEDLNHHGTLFAGKTAMWFVEAGFIAAASLTHPENIVCINVHGMLFKKPVRSGKSSGWKAKLCWRQERDWFLMLKCWTTSAISHAWTDS